MNWLAVISGAASGAFAAVLVTILFKDWRNSRFASGAVFVVLFVVIGTMSREFIMPMINDWRTESVVEAELLKHPIYQVMRDYEPETYDAIKKDAIMLSRSNNSQAEVGAAIRARLMPVAMRRMSTAPDSAVIPYFRAQLDSGRLLQTKSGDLCYKYLMASGPPVNWTEHIPKSQMESEVALLEAVIRGSATNSQEQQPEDVVTTILEPVLYRVAELHPEDIELFDHLEDPSIDHTKACALMIDFFAEILTLETADAGTVIRYLALEAN